MASEAEEEAANDLVGTLRSSAEVTLRNLRGGLVLQLYKQRGPFWESVKECRSRRGIRAIQGLPPHSLDSPLPPPNLPAYFPSGERGKLERDQALELWAIDLNAVVVGVVPERHYTGSLRRYWAAFASVCLLYDPQDADLVSFATSADLRVATMDSLVGGAHEAPARMVASPIRTLADPSKYLRFEEVYWMEILRRLAKLYLEPAGVTLREALEQLHKQYPEINRQAENMRASIERRDYIKVDEHTTKEDVLNAFRVIKHHHQERPKAKRPSRDPLVCVECAVLHDRHGYSYERLAQRYRWRDSNLASKYIRDGRTILDSW